MASIRMNSSAAAKPKKDDAAAAAAQAKYKIVQKLDNFNEIQSKRPNFDHSRTPIEVTKSPYPDWGYGQGVPDGGVSASKNHVEIDPYVSDRPMVNNYRLLVSGIAPRPIGFISTISGDGENQEPRPIQLFPGH